MITFIHAVDSVYTFGALAFVACFVLFLVGSLLSALTRKRCFRYFGFMLFMLSASLMLTGLVVELVMLMIGSEDAEISQAMEETFVKFSHRQILAAMAAVFDVVTISASVAYLRDIPYLARPQKLVLKDAELSLENSQVRGGPSRYRYVKGKIDEKTSRRFMLDEKDYQRCLEMKRQIGSGPMQVTVTCLPHSETILKVEPDYQD